MDVFVRFIESDSFFPVLMLLLLALLFVFAWAIYNGKRQLNNRRFQVRNLERMPEISQLETDDYQENQLELVSINDNVLKEDANKEEKKSFLDAYKYEARDNAVKENKNTSDSIGDIELIDAFKRPEVQDLDVKIPEKEEISLVSEKEEPIKEEIKTEVNISNKQEYLFKKEQIMEEKEEEPTIEETTIELPIEKDVETEESKTSIDPFASTPVADVSINENIEVPSSTEYTSEKTEIFDFPDFSDLFNAKEEEEKIENEIIDAASKYIESIMANHEE